MTKVGTETCEVTCATRQHICYVIGKTRCCTITQKPVSICVNIKQFVNGSCTFLLLCLLEECSNENCSENKLVTCCSYSKIVVKGMTRAEMILKVCYISFCAVSISPSDKFTISDDVFTLQCDLAANRN